MGTAEDLIALREKVTDIELQIPAQGRRVDSTIPLKTRLTDLAEPPLEFFNVMDYGASVDDVSDEGGAIQRAIDAADTAGTGNVVYFPPGTYNISSTITLPDNITLCGTSRGTVIKATGLTPMFTASTGNNLIIHDLALNGVDKMGDGINFAVGSHGFSYIRDVTLVNFASAFSGASFTEGMFSGIRINNCTNGFNMSNGWINVAFSDIILSDCDIAIKIDDVGANEGLVFNNIHTLSGSVPIKIEDCTQVTFNNCVFDLYDDQIQIFGGDEIYFNNCWFSNSNGGATDPGILIQPVENTIARMGFNQCIWANCKQYGIRLADQDGTDPSEIKVTSCDFVNNGTGDMDLNAVAGLRVVNTFFGNTAGTHNISFNSTGTEVTDAHFSNCKFAHATTVFSASTVELYVSDCQGFNTDTVESAPASGGITLTTSFADVTGATVTLTRAGRWLIRGYFDFQERANGGTDVGQAMSGQILANSVAQPAQAIFVASAASGRVVVSCEAEFVATADGQTAKLQAKKAAGTGASTCNITHSNIIAHMVAPA